MGALFGLVIIAVLVGIGGVFIEVYEAGIARGRAEAEAEARQRLWASLRSVTADSEVTRQHASGAWRVVRALFTPASRSHT